LNTLKQNYDSRRVQTELISYQPKAPLATAPVITLTITINMNPEVQT